MSDHGCDDGVFLEIDYRTFTDSDSGPTAVSVERCDECKVFEGDLDAAWFISQRAKRKTRVFYYQDGERDDEDEKAGVYEFTGTYTEGLCIAYGSDPWVEVVNG